MLPRMVELFSKRKKIMVNEISKIEFQQAINLAIENGLSIYDLAAKIESAPGSITRWMHGHTFPMPFRRKQILQVISKLQKDNK